MKSDETTVFIRFHQFSSDFISFYQLVFFEKKTDCEISLVDFIRFHQWFFVSKVFVKPEPLEFQVCFHKRLVVYVASHFGS